MANLLQFERSPYLLQHKDNPVQWYPWGEEAFQAACREDKPVFLSIGYSTCHWCHVMAHESFEDEAVAEVLNRSFISIKVDREERPDVDGVYMAACIAMTGSGGWPLTVLMTPEQKPFWAGTYLPKAALLSLLEQAELLWQRDREQVLSSGEALSDYLRREEESRPGAPRRELAARAFHQLEQAFDPRWGGFGAAPKFPTPHNLVFLMRYARCSGEKRALEMAEKTLEGMFRGGLFDHVGGGFSRYSTDARWLVPHFEKMLYDNALLLYTYAEAYQTTHSPLWKRSACETASYVLRELKSPEGGFYCAQDADSEGEEGKYYTFTPEELRSVLGERDAAAFCSRYGVTDRGNFEGKSIPNLIGQPDPAADPEGMEAIREKLYRYRKSRTKLHRDDKVLTAWNGLMTGALAKAGLVFDAPDYLAAAERAVSFLEDHLTTGEGRLLARWREGQGGIDGKLEDYAFYAWGLLELYGATFHTKYLKRAAELADELLERFFDREQGGFYPYASDAEQLLTRKKETFDGAMPSGNAVAALVLSRLSRLTGEEKWRKAAGLQFSYLAGAAEQYPAGHCFTMLALLEELWPTAELVCVSNEAPGELFDFLREAPRPEWTILVKTPDNEEELTTLAPFTADYPIPDRGAQYYLCENGACAQPVEHISDLKVHIK